MAGILRWSNSIFKSVLPILVTWYRKTGELWKTANSLAAWGWSVSVDTGVKTTPERVKPITISLQVVGSQQDNSGQQMQRTITGYRKSDGVAVVLYDYTTGLGPTINSTVTVTLDGSVEYNRFVGYIGGKLAAGTTITIKATEWDQNEPWFLILGTLFNMTSRTAPSPFVASSEGSAYPTDDWKFFNTSTDVWNPQVLTYCVAKIDLVTPVRLAECQIKINYGAYDYATFRIEASNDNTNWTELWNSGSINTTLNSTLTIDSVIAYRYYRVRLNAPTNTGWTWEKFVITKWYK